jgi:PIN domain nuclease of toxin-antitoxin system
MLASPRKLGARARAIIEKVEAGRDQAWLPAAVVAELLILRGLGKLGIGLPEVKNALESCPNLRFLPLDLVQLEEFAALSAVRDPFDRLMVSASRAMHARLLTRDQALAESGLIETVWD